MGYVDDMYAYRVWDIAERKTREVSFFHSVVHEGFYPFLDKGKWPEPESELPSSFFPTFEDTLVPEEFKKFSFSEEACLDIFLLEKVRLRLKERLKARERLRLRRERD